VRARALRGVGSGSLLVGLLALGGASCIGGKPVVTSPVDGSTIGAAGDVTVTVQLADPAATTTFKLLSGVDEPPPQIVDVSARFTIAGGVASATLGMDDLAAGRNTLVVSVDRDGDGKTDVTTSSSFTRSPRMTAAACKRVIPPVAPSSPWKDGSLGGVPYPPVNHTDPIYMAGFGTRTASSVHDHLWARGVVIESRGRKIALVTVDLVGYFNNEIQTIRGLVNDPSFDTIVVSSTHQHEGPDTMGLWGPSDFESGVSLQYLDFVNGQVAGCIADAQAALVDAEMRIATGDTVGTSLPPEPDLVADGEILQHLCVGHGAFFDANGVCVGGTEVQGDAGPVRNPSVPMIQIRDRTSQQVLATLVNYASHPEALGSQNREITADFPHFMREALEQRYGGTAIYVAGDVGVLQGPLDVFLADPQNPAQQVPRRCFAFAEVMGEILADRAGDALDAEPDWTSSPEIEVAKSGPILIEVENPYFSIAGAIGIFGRRGFTTDPARPDDEFVTTEVQAVRIGDAQLAISPNELDPQIGNVYRAQMTNARHRFLVGLGNDEIGYQMQQAKFNPSCFLCFTYNLFGGDPIAQGCPIATNDCGTVFQNNIGPGADPLLQATMSGLVSSLND